MHLLVIVYAMDMNVSVPFYELLGLERTSKEPIDAMWNEFRLGDARLALHGLGDGELPISTARVQVNLDVPAGGSLDEIFTRCKDHAIEVGNGITDEGFGRFFWVRDPDGLPVQINERAGASAGA